MNSELIKSQKYIHFKYLLIVILMIFSITLLASKDPDYHSITTYSKLGKSKVEVRAIDFFTSVLLYYLPALYFTFTLIRHKTKKRCEKIKFKGFGHYRIRMFLNGYLISLIFFMTLYFISYLISIYIFMKINNYHHYYASERCLAALIILFFPVFFAAIDIPFAAKIKDSHKIQEQ
jgi:hypothetical protein